MSSSYAIRQKQLRDENKLKMHGVVYGDVFIRPNGECHPDFISIPINKIDGPRVCVRKPERERVHTFDRTTSTQTRNLYAPKKDFIIDRTRNIPREVFEKMPAQDQLVKDGYLKWEKRQDPLGIPNALWYNNGYNVSSDYQRQRTYLNDERK